MEAPGLAIDIDQAAREQALSTESLLIQDVPIEVYVGPFTSLPKLSSEDRDEESFNGQRTMFGVYARSSRRVHLIKLISGPAEFRVSEQENDDELLQERRALNVISRHSVSPSIVASLPRAFQSYDTIYESTAPGISSYRAIALIANAYHHGELTEQEVALMLARMHSSALQSLDGLHDLGIKHNHPHRGNFNVDPATGFMTLMDYTFAEKGRFTAPYLNQDNSEFESDWKIGLQDAGLSGIRAVDLADAGAANVAIAKLEHVVIRNALRELGFENVSNDEVERFIEAQLAAIEAAPAVVHPKSTLRKRIGAYVAHVIAKVR